MKKITGIFGPHGSGKTARSRQVIPATPIGNVIEIDVCQHEIKNAKDIGCTDETKTLILKNIPDQEAFERLADIVAPFLSEDSGISHIVFTSANVNPFSLPEKIKDQMEIIKIGFENEKQLIYSDDDLYKDEIAVLERLAKYINEIIRIFVSFSVGTFIKEELLDLIFNTKKFVSTKQINNGEVVVNNLKLNKEKLMELVELPEDFGKLEKIINLAQTQIQNIMISQRIALPSDVFKLYIFDQNDNLELKTRVYQKVKEETEVYINSVEAKKAYFFAKEFVGLLKKYKIEPFYHESVIGAYITADKKGKYVVNTKGIKSREINNMGFHSFSKN
ncbi:hypothetical protein [Agriterribacter sp.]|uniref:hypothetical protein n=1 Tax=Agriterribacter sp. TaxID=2821509 RepID=UPI002BE1C2C0|nr:hypothetical protein [Agriterribacter sp.]HRO45127.1 hypothetical protein [Agriterribacter sp.]HRQ15432.1 hypothetical protein [Agriterribacter sp.]